MGDNKQIKDGLGDLFTSRMKDISSAQDGTVQRTLLFASLYPLDYVPGGIFQHRAMTSADMPPALSSAPIYAFQWSSASMLAAIWKIRLQAWTTGTAFSGGLARFSLHAARAFSAQYTNGFGVNFVGNQSKLRTSMSSSQANVVYANGVALTPGVTTLDSDPLESIIVTGPTLNNTPFTPTPMPLLDKAQGEHPLLLASEEGFVVQATIPFAGTWQFAMTVAWTELPQF